MQVRKRALAVCGSGHCGPDVAALAQELGRLVVQQGWVLVCGGKGGVMEAACRGGQQARVEGAGGLVLGIVPEARADAANPFCDVVIPTGMGYARNVMVVLSADVVVLVGGSSGTLSEAAFAWQFGKPLIALAPAGGWAGRLAGTAIDERRQDTVLSAATPEQAVTLAQGLMPG
jgi:uncharacterized protein (TIGR00725 family)